MPEQKQPVKRYRPLTILTRKEGVREENPLFEIGGKYYPPSNVRTPELREQADKLIPPIKRLKGMTIEGQKMLDNYLKSKGF